MATVPSIVDIAPTRANSTLADLYLLYADRYAGWFPVAVLVDLLGSLGVSETNVRATLSRYRKASILERVPRHGVVGYQPAGTWGEMMPEAQRYLKHRIFDEPPALAEGWALVSFSFPESARRDRHLLRSLLTKEGFGCVSSGLWIFPGGEMDRVLRIVRSTGFEENVVVFSAQHLAFGPVRDLVARSWDLEALASGFDDFLAAYGEDRTTARGGESAFVAWTLAHNHLRHLVGSCPSLPTEVLPRGWPALEAMRVMRQLAQRLAAPAGAYVDGIVADRS